MCDIRKYPNLYSKADWILRVMRLSKEMPGYDLLQRAIVVWEVEKESITSKIMKQLAENVTEKEKKKLLEKELIRRVEEIAPMKISKNRLINNQKSAVEQAMIEAIRAVSKNGNKKSILDFVTDITENIF